MEMILVHTAKKTKAKGLVYSFLYRGLDIMRNQLKVDLTRKVKKSDLEPALCRYRRFLVDLGFRESTIDMYSFVRCMSFVRANIWSSLRQNSLQQRISLGFAKYFRIKGYHDLP